MQFYLEKKINAVKIRPDKIEQLFKDVKLLSDKSLEIDLVYKGGLSLSSMKPKELIATLEKAPDDIEELRISVSHDEFGFSLKINEWIGATLIVGAGSKGATIEYLEKIEDCFKDRDSWNWIFKSWVYFLVSGMLVGFATSTSTLLTYKKYCTQGLKGCNEILIPLILVPFFGILLAMLLGRVYPRVIYKTKERKVGFSLRKNLKELFWTAMIICFGLLITWGISKM